MEEIIGEVMIRNILTDVKKFIGFTPDYDYFDIDILIRINTAVDYLRQLGVTFAEDYTVTENSIWADLIGSYKNLKMIKSYICYYARKRVDPPANSVLMASIDNELNRLEFRINVAVETHEL